MSILGILIYTLIVLPFSWFLFTTGMRVFRVRSYKTLFENVRKNPNAYGLFERYFLGFDILDGMTTSWMLKLFGDRATTIWFRASGIMMIVFALLFLLGNIGIWIIYFINL